MANSYRSQMHRTTTSNGARSIHDDVRTPDAWRQREHNLHSRHNHNHNNHQPHHHHHHSHQQQQQQQQRPHSATGSTTTTADDTSSEVETSVSGRRYNRLAAPPAPPMYARGAAVNSGANTLRSTRSVPALNWSDEPCPIHGGGGHHHHNNQQHDHHHHPQPHMMQLHPSLLRHPHQHHPPIIHQPQFHPQYPPTTMRRAGSMFDMRVSNNPNLIYPPVSYSAHPMPGYVSTPMQPPIDKKSHYGSLRSLHSISAQMQMNGGGGVPPGAIPPPYHLPPMPPPHLLPPGMRARPLVIPAGAEPLPVRDPAKTKGGSISGLSHHTLIGPGGIPVLNGGGGKLAMIDGGVGEYKPRRRYHCCRGPLPLVWFIITIVILGVVLGVVLGSIYG